MKVCYLSSTALGKEMFLFLQKQKCIITYANTENEKIRDFNKINYDLGISFLYTYKIPASEFKKGKIWLNFHPGPLPEYRGRNLGYHAIKESAKYFGATLHYMDEEFDTGKIIKVQRFNIENVYTAGDLSEFSKKALAELFKEYMPRILKGEKVPSKAQIKDGRYYKQEAINEEIFLSSEQQKEVRALTVSPRFYAHTFINGKKYYLIPESDYKKS